MSGILNPSLPEIVRINADNLDEAVSQLVSDLTPRGGFNYLPATKCVKSAYKGLHSIKSLVAMPSLNDGSVGATHNREVAKLLAPLAFGRSTSVFDLSPRSFIYGKTRQASYRIPFFFVEGGVVKLYYMQPRKGTTFTKLQAELYVSIAKKFLLENEFYDERTDVEFVECSERNSGEGRTIASYSLDDLDIWEDGRIARHLKAVDEALQFIEANIVIPKRRRPLKDSDLPLFS